MGGSSDRTDEPAMKLLRPEFAELFQKLHHDIRIMFPSIDSDGDPGHSPEVQMIAAVGALMSLRMDQSVMALKTPAKMMKMGPGGVILPGG